MKTNDKKTFVVNCLFSLMKTIGKASSCSLSQMRICKNGRSAFLFLQGQSEVSS